MGEGEACWRTLNVCRRYQMREDGEAAFVMLCLDFPMFFYYQPNKTRQIQKPNKNNKNLFEHHVFT